MMSDHSLLSEAAPSGWMQGRFDDLCQRVQDATSPSADGQRLFIGLEHLASGRPAFVGRGNETDVKSGKTEFQAGDVLFGKLRPYLRKSAIASERGICSTDILVFRATKKASPEFVCYVTHSDEFIGHAKATTSGVQHPRTSWGALREFQLQIPPLAEQRRIVSVLGSVLRLVEHKERLLQVTGELKKALLQKFFTEGLFGELQKETAIGLVPESWKERALEETGEVVYGIQAAVASNLKPVGTKILTNKNLTLDGRIVTNSINYFVLKTKRHHETILRKGDLLFNWRSGSKEHVGKSAYFDRDEEFTHSSFILRIRPYDQVIGRYLFYYLIFLRASGYFVKS